MRLNHFIAGAVAGFLPLAAVAAPLEMRINDGELIISDGGAGDNSGLSNILSASLGPISGYEVVSANVIKQEAPPYDQLQADVNVFNQTGGPASIKIEVTGHFTNNSAALQPGLFSATANDVVGSTWNISSYIGSSAYDQQILGLSESGSLFAVSNLIRFNPNDYWITHIFEHAADRDGVSAGANADFVSSPDVTPIPVPAAGFLLVGALGGLAALRRRKG